MSAPTLPPGRQRPSHIDIAPPAADQTGSGTVPLPEPSLVREIVKAVAAEARAELGSSPAPAGGGQGGGRGIGPAILLALALGGAFLVQRGEATREMVAEARAEQAKVTAAMEARVAAVEAERVKSKARESARDDALREALFVLAEDSRAVWDALEQINEHTKPTGAPPLRKPATSSRLSGLRDSVGRGE